MDTTTIGTISAPGMLVSDGWVGFGDEVDYMSFTLTDAAKLSFHVESTDQTRFAIYELTNRNGVYSLTVKQQVVPTKARGATEYTVDTAGLLLTAGTYYIGVTSTNAKQGGNADYTVALNGGTSSVFYTKGDNSDDWTDLKTAGAAGAVDTTTIGTISAPGMLVSDGWVGFGDEVDYMSFTLTDAAKLSFHVESTDQTRFAIYELTNRNGVYSLTVKQQVVPTKARGATEYTVDTAGLLLTAGTYYIGVTSTNAKQGGNADYTVALNGGTSSVFYTKGDNSDDSVAEVIANGIPALNINAVDVSQMLIDDGWVGYGDAADYREIVYAGSEKLSFTVTATDAARFTLYELSAAGIAVQKQSVTLSKSDGAYIGKTAGFALESGKRYFIAVTSTNATTGGNADYTVEANFTGSGKNRLLTVAGIALKAWDGDENSLTVQTIAGSSDNENIRFTAGQVSRLDDLALGLGNDQITVSNAEVFFGDVDLGNGDNTLTVSGTAAYINCGGVIAENGNDTIVINGTKTEFVATAIDLGAGNDKITLTRGEAESGAVALGDGNDQFTIAKDAVWRIHGGMATALDFGTGANDALILNGTLDLSDFTGGAIASGLEKISGNGQLLITDALEAALAPYELQRFADAGIDVINAGGFGEFFSTRAAERADDTMQRARALTAAVGTLDVWLCGEDKAAARACGLADTVDYIRFTKTAAIGELEVSLSSDVTFDVFDLRGNSYLPDVDFSSGSLDVSAWANGTYYFKLSVAANSCGGGWISIQ